MMLSTTADRSAAAKLPEKSQLRRGHHLYLTADSDVKPAAIPIKDRPPFRFEAGHRSNQKPASFRH
ncbi:hypothetical protein NKJ13_31255 [Mesorhizobium sp. M0174]|uniref:hypothetical protein n=1 Tax=Mesorhizobium sp. M0174 TaxID=2956904 RepID=UPI00333C38E1